MFKALQNGSCGNELCFSQRAKAKKAKVAPAPPSLPEEEVDPDAFFGGGSAKVHRSEESQVKAPGARAGVKQKSEDRQKLTPEKVSIPTMKNR